MTTQGPSDRNPEGSGNRTPLALWLAVAGFAALCLYRLTLTWAASPEFLAAMTPDDAYYYLGTARHFAAGEGSTFDGTNPTNGYHPLWFLVCAATARLSGTSGTPAGALDLFPRMVITFELILGAAAFAILARRARLLFGTTGAALVLAGACLPWTIYGMTDGLESGATLLAVAVLFKAAVCWHPLTAAPSMRDAAFGGMLALAFLARLDLALLILALGGWTFIEWLRGDVGTPARSASWITWKTLLWSAPVLVVLGVYLLINGASFDTMTPISGIMKNTFPRAAWHGEWLLAHTVPFAAGGVAVSGAFALWRRGTVPPDARHWFAIGALFVLLQTANTLLFMRWAVHKWHFTAFWPFALAAGGGVVSLVLQEKTPRLRARLGTAAVALLVLAGAAAQWRIVQDREHSAFQVQSYRAAAALSGTLPAGTRIGMTDCGVFGYYMGDGVINLDGVINNMELQTTLRDSGLESYFRLKGITAAAHHAVPADRVAHGYGTTVVAAPVSLFDIPPAFVTVREEDELYRGPEYVSGGKPVRFMVWRWHETPGSQQPRP